MKNNRLLLFTIAILLLSSAGFVHASTTMENEIVYLLRFISSTDCSFIRNNSEYTASDASVHIEKKYRYVKSRVTTTEDFISLAASESSFSGKPYRVNCAGKQLLSKDWLLEELRRYRQADAIAAKQFQ